MLKKALTSSLLVLIYWALNAQSEFEKFYYPLIALDSSFDLMEYDMTYIIHFNFCSSNKYCGKKLIDYINRNKGKKILLLSDDVSNPLFCFLNENNFYYIAYIDTYFLQRNGIFSAYNIEIRKTKIVRKLL